MDDDEMELGDTGWIPEAEGWFRNKYTGERLDADGNLYDRAGELLLAAPDDDD